MSFARKNNTASLFKNDKKTTDSQPFAKGEALIDNVEYYVSAWNNVGKNGTPYQSLAFERKDAVLNKMANNSGNRPQQQPPSNTHPFEFNSFDDDMPF